jgi:hypothetical protein
MYADDYASGELRALKHGGDRSFTSPQSLARFDIPPIPQDQRNLAQQVSEGHGSIWAGKSISLCVYRETFVLSSSCYDAMGNELARRAEHNNVSLGDL